MNLSSAQFERESGYRLAVSVIKNLRAKGLLTEAEYRKAKERIGDKYNPIWGHYPDAAKPSSYHELP